MWTLNLVISFLSLINYNSGQFIQQGPCNDNIVTNVGGDFGIETFTGTWYEIATSGDYFTGGQCSSLQFSYNSSTEDVTIQHTAVFDNFYREQSFVATVDNETAKFTVNLTDGTQIDYWVLITNPDFFAALYSCENISPTESRVHIWQLGRQLTPLNQIMTALFNTTLINSVSRPIDDLSAIDHSDFGCYILPEIEEGAPIVLEGLCNPNLAVVPNLRVEDFLGEWHQISSYVSESSTGDCPRAQYTLQNGNVLVENSEVINETLRMITGSASVSSEDGSGKLSVVLEVAPNVTATQDLWVLDTDYENYAVLYSCVDITNTTRRIFSWISSRHNSLSADSQEAVNAVIDRYVELNHEYYHQASHTDEACFYYPEPALNLPVIFRGQCDENIEVVTDFNPDEYKGLWHEIESYPNTFELGTCVNALYSINDAGYVDVYNTQVINERLDTINGYAVVAFDDGSAKLNVSFPILGTNQTITSNYWVLDTDYTSYSLVYSCTNLPLNRQLVFSWKLSRTKELTENATIAINNTMNTVQVLRDEYYEPTDQSREACFYYPEPELGKPVVFPGQCDDNVTVVNNFNFTQFEGVWYEIEAYPKIEQDGTCISHDYSASGNSLDLITTQITNQFLSTSSSLVTFSSNDGSAKLNININVNGSSINIPFWILSTDYTDYALAYSCVDIDDDFRGIWSWKLSREKVLSPESNSSINAVIDTVDVLGSQYYEPIGQDDEDCFYLPEIPPGQPIILPGQCDPNITVVQNFEADRYEGLWHLVESYYSDFQTGTCNDATYTLRNGTVDVLNTQVINQTLNTITGTATLATTNGDAKLLVYFPGTDEPSDYWVLDTDYENYSLVYSCVNLPNSERRIFSWKLSRSRTLSLEDESAINTVINSVNVLNNAYFEEIDNSPDGCFYYPEADGNPVVFRGQCDVNIAVVENFNPVLYQGLWHEIASYPSSFQQGTCNNAYYTLNGGVVDVFNTQVINQSLDTIDGTAVLASDDGSAKLTVSFPIAETNVTTSTSYWVLDTDYTSYSLVYSCQDIEDERIVFAWKLSRSKTLSANASTQMDAIIQSIPVLDDQYFEESDQTDEGCFFYPDPQPGVPVLFPGTCDDSINVTQNFNLTQFSGEWFEIEAYPKEPQNGQCISHDYTVEGNAFSLISSQVSNQLLDIYSSSVTITSNDGSAKLSITLSSNGTQIVIPFWIIDTDYENYALAYSCVDNLSENDAHTRGVWSWKLSRTKTLSQTSLNAISDAAAPINVIDNRYFEPVGQTDDDCFYLPDLSPGVPVIFVGQCDPNITVVQSFDPTGYEGLWHLIESYHTEFQMGDCNNARYTLADGVVNVLNTEVINENLSEIVGTAVLATSDGSGKLLVSFGSQEQSDYWILDTDYKNYSLVYSCVNLPNNQRRVYSWKLSRTRELTPDARLAIDSKVAEVNVLNDQYFEPIDQTEDACFYYPEVDVTKPVLFRGRCDPNIAVVQEFNVTRYLGLWHDIESFPQQFQDGTCPEANYDLNTDGTVGVLNTQVINQVLDSITGVAVSAGDDGSAKLRVTFPIAETNFTVTTDYWVLDTDYTSYSLVYSCEEIDEEYRRVSSWKLSRNKTLSSIGIDNINAITSNIKVLDQRYFRQSNQTEDDCFYYPDNNGGPVIWDGQCEDVDVPVVENFNLNDFQGTWHEMARIPSELQTSQCASFDFTPSGQNTLIISQSSVENESLMTATGSATLVDDQGGILDAVLTNENGSITMTLRVLATDYEAYALLYSCRNINNSQRQVYSWKLSKSRSGLSPEADAAISQVVTDTQDITESYFANSDQSVVGCFYYPEFTGGLPSSIVLPGPCQDITTIQNFDAGAYVDRWYEIARYPQADQFGQCSQAEYTADGGSIIVYNNEVVNRTLSGITGSATANADGVVSVTFNINGMNVVQNLYVIDTDYTNYSLVFSCRDLESGDSQVGSWKLSRAKTLSAEATATIDNLVNTRYGLRQTYYLDTDQSDEACFYIPEVQVDEPVRFRGSCNESITGQPDFNINQFLGWWHVIESYPTGNNDGVCRSTQYEESGNTFIAVDTSVFDLSAQINSSIVTATNDGKITRAVNGEIVQEYWVLATDYQDYALVYSCKNDGEYREVWSAKYSKLRNLNQDSQDLMAPHIDQIEVLDNRFYLPVSQSSSDCFFYPETNGERIILPGTCDTGIPVQQEFDAVQYSGTWYQLERYPQVFEAENSSCTGARYTPDLETGIVSVLNWEVNNGTLETIEGTAVQTAVPAILDVTLPIVGTENNVTIQLYVLQTDYISYSLVYSCENIGEYQRAVGAWKLSRTRSLPASANTAINSYMADREELYQPYFIQIHQDEDCEEPSSAFLARSSIIVILACMMLHNLF